MQITLDGKPKETKRMLEIGDMEWFLDGLKDGECYTTYGLMEKLNITYYKVCKIKKLLEGNRILYGNSYIYGSKKTISEYKKVLKA